MKKVSMEVKFEIAQEIAGLFDINVEGLDHENLVNSINEQIDNLTAAKPAKAGKWYESKELPFKEGDLVDVVDGWAKGRLVKIEKPSAKVDAFKGYLINPKTGEPQGTLVTVDGKDITIHVENLVEEIKEETKEEEGVA